MIPIRDDQPRFSAPYLNNFLIGLNLLIFLFESALDPESLKALIYQFGVIPSHVTALLAGTSRYQPAAVLVPFLTSMFLHGSWMHVIGNMWFLWIFGDNIEDHLGHFTYLLFYLLSGVVAAMTQVALDPHLRVPTVGASGAIAGVLGAYFVLYPKARVLNLVSANLLLSLAGLGHAGILVRAAISKRGGNLDLLLQPDQWRDRLLGTRRRVCRGNRTD